MRGFLARASVNHKRLKLARTQRAAVTITSVFYIACAKKAALRKKLYRKKLLQRKMCAKLQLCWRKHRDYLKLQQKKQQRRAQQAHRTFAAIKIQAAGRVYLAGKFVQRRKALRRGREKVTHRKATILQRAFRGYCARKIANKRKEKVQEMAQKRVKAAITIQRKLRVFRTCQLVSQRTAYKRFRLACCVKLQSLLRGALARLHTAEMRLERREHRQLQAAVKLQTRVRMILARLELLRRRLVHREAMTNRSLAASAINNRARVKLAFMQAKRRREERLVRLQQTVRREMKAACCIQALYRGMKGRERFEQKLREKKGKWKELFDEKVGKRFFYNKLSGEIRWRMPQDLLDLIPHPSCDECGKKQAVLECSVCSELFCTRCWEKVHAGGRRRAHDFRALYDYYGKRLDYGDGEFPCKWPTEVMQDEVQGWMLRVAPARLALRVYEASGWEEYHENAA